MDQGLNQKIDAYIAENKEQLLQDIAALVAEQQLSHLQVLLMR